MANYYSVRPTATPFYQPRPRQTSGAVENTWLPSDFPGLTVWLDAGFGVEADTSWTDRTGNVTLTAVSGFSFPTYNPTGLNGRPTMDFNGTTHYIRGALTTGVTNPCHYIVAFWNDANGGLFEYSTSASVGNSHSVMFNDGGYISGAYLFRCNPILDGFANRIEVTSTYDSSPQWSVYALFSINTTQFRTRIYDSSAKAYISPGNSTAYGAWSRTATHVGLGSIIAAPTVYPFNGRIAELLTYSGVGHNNRDSYLVIDYLRRKYGL